MRLPLAIILLAGPALADPVGYYGNTLQIHRTTGTGTLLYRPDHSFTLHTIAGETVQGTWHAAGGKLCLNPLHASLKPFLCPR